jgi:hypothetical protein
VKIFEEKAKRAEMIAKSCALPLLVVGFVLLIVVGLEKWLEDKAFGAELRRGKR